MGLNFYCEVTKAHFSDKSVVCHCSLNLDTRDLIIINSMLKLLSASIGRIEYTFCTIGAICQA